MKMTQFDSKLKTIVDAIKRRYNKVRIYIKWILGKGVQRHRIIDEKGNEHDVTFEQQKEKVCDHGSLDQVSEILWKCRKCDYAYFMIPHKIILSRTDLINFMENIADHFEAEVVDKGSVPEPKE